MEELKIKIEQAGTIETNLEVLKNELSEIAKNYEGIVVGEDDVSLAKQDLARLRKLRTEIEDKRKQIKKEWNTPYLDFENKVKEALTIIDTPISEIDKQVKAYEQKEKEKKAEKIREIYNENVPDEIKPYLSFEAAFNERWLNKSVKKEEIISDLNATATQKKIDISAIQALNSEIEDECLKIYNITGSMAAAIQRNTDYLNAKTAAEAKAREETERKIKEEQEKATQQETPKAEENLVLDEVKDMPFDDLPFPEETLTIKVIGEESVRKVKAWSISEHINFEVIE